MTEVPGRRNRRALQCAAMGIGGFVAVLGLAGLAGNLDGGDAGGGTSRRPPVTRPATLAAVT